ncbi:Pyridine nucleotide-disulfide oxidoreductase family protein [Crinalium epipsammum PCC 9333]|uniref:Pyridine nucleotide-disulfide oxidoreductase family protein n=1 Tax=Crinalium epipsammum PCC 9333 TaxID=1173022 RepID=K9W5L5_9CYAN|nr:FAD-dependent oxidoreductase [Crinalium epipsammum]AFZ14770.1 Pyridine nucleotide-disulfide oxidoreductase family protein [Crinalium epipsammum PCC 9333]
MPFTQSIVKKLVLIGGGHSHAIALKLFGINPLPGVQLTLITECVDTPYSGMLPGHVAGFYTHEQCHINLSSLAQFAQANLIIDQAISLDLEKNLVICANSPPVPFDLLSINIGSTPARESVVGATDYAIPVKPVKKFLAVWNDLLEKFTKNPQKPISLTIVGGGAGGVELAMAMRSRLDQILKNSQQPTANLKINLCHRYAELLPHHNRWVRTYIQQILTQKGIHLYLKEKVNLVQPHQLICESGLTIDSDYIFWVTQASAPSWLQTAGLATDNNFVLVDDTLQSLSHPYIFATGDIATMVNHPRPKAGVFAVRQGEPLFKNLQHALLGKPLKPYIPQKQYLNLIGTGDKSAIASWGVCGCASPILWRLKDQIDRNFMVQFKDLPQSSALT